MQVVLGVAMTPTTVRLALVEGEKADGVIVDYDVFDVGADDGPATSRVADDVIAAVLGTQEGAIAAGHHLVSTGVTWTDRAEAAALREALDARGIEDVLLVSELHAAAALAQAVGRVLNYDKTALLFIEREKATLGVVETADGAVVKVLSEKRGGDAAAVAAEMVTGLEAHETAAQTLFVVGCGVDVTAVTALLKHLVEVPVIAPEESQFALARGAALASANAPRYDAATVGLAYSLDPDGTTAQSMSLADLLGGDDATPDAAGIAFGPDGSSRNKPFLMVGSALTAVFVAGMTALTVAMAVNVQPTADRASGASPMPPNAAPPPAVERTLPAPQLQLPSTAAPTPAAPPESARLAQAQLKAVPAPPPQVPTPPPQVVVHDSASAPAAPPPPAPAAPPALQLPMIQLPVPFLPPVLAPPPYYVPSPPPYYPTPKDSRGHGHGHGHGGDGEGD